MNEESAKKGRSHEEDKFRVEVIVPLLKRMGFLDVTDTQGIAEFGKDVIFAEYDRFGRKKWYAAQLKAGDVSGKVDGKVNELVAQVHTAIDVPFNDLVTKEEVHVSEVYVIISGRFKDNAKTILLNRLKAVKNWVHFLDADQVARLQGIHFREVADVLTCLLKELDGNINFAPAVRKIAQEKSTYLYYSYASEHLARALTILTPISEFKALVEALEVLRVELHKSNRALELLPVSTAVREPVPEYGYLEGRADALIQFLPKVREQVLEHLKHLPSARDGS